MQISFVAAICLVLAFAQRAGAQSASSDHGTSKKKVEPIQPIHKLLGHAGRLTSVACSPDGQWIATAAWDATARLWDAKTGKEVQRADFPDTNGFKAKVDQIAFSPDNAFIVTLLREPSNDGVVVVWDRSLKKRAHEIPGQRFAISADGKKIACSQMDENPLLIRIFELATGELIQEMEGAYARVDLLAFSADSKTLYAQVGMPRPKPEKGASRGRDGAQVRVWDVASGNERKSPLEGAWQEPLLIVAPDGRTLAVRDLQTSQAITLRETATSGPRAVLAGHTDDVTDVAFSPDGRTLASASMDRTVRLWDLPSGREIGRLTGHGHWVLSVAFSPDGGALVSGGFDKTAFVWDVRAITRRPGGAAERSPAQLQADWHDLAGDAKSAYGALGRLVAAPRTAVSFLGQQLQHDEPKDRKHIERLIGELDDTRFSVRERAMKELMALAAAAGPALEDALADRPSLELKRRLLTLLDRLGGATLTPDAIHRLRAVEALELIGTPDARQLLETIAASRPPTHVTREASAAARRLAKWMSQAP